MGDVLLVGFVDDVLLLLYVVNLTNSLFNCDGTKNLDRFIDTKTMSSDIKRSSFLLLVAIK